MQRTVVIGAAVIAALALILGLAGCGSDSKDGAAPAAESGAAGTTTTTSGTPQPKVALLPDIAEPNPTITGYLRQHGITQTQVRRGDAGVPSIDLPIPEGWADAGADTPRGAYYAVINTGPEAHKYLPSIVAWVSKLTGEVDQQQLLDLAVGQLQNLPGFGQLSAGSSSTLSGFPAYQFGGTWVPDGQKEGQKRMVAQKTVVIAGSDGVYLLQLNVDCLESQLDVVVPATLDIDEKTTITT